MLPEDKLVSSGDQFVRALQQSNLLTPSHLTTVLENIPSAIRTCADQLAEWFVASGHLTQFQSDKLRHGFSAGLVLGQFHVLSPLGQGGMGTVFLGRDTRSGDLVALKLLLPKKAREAEHYTPRFQREMDLCQRVQHPRIAQTFEVGVTQNVHYIAMEYIAGTSLTQLVASEGRLAVDRTARLALEIVAGLSHAHAVGLVHRDLKPSNVMVTPEGHAKLLDFGLALIQGEEGSTDKLVTGGKGYVVGTMDYISPEQIENPLHVDARSDYYSLGCTLYFATTGQPPFAGGTSVQKMQRQRTETAPLVNQLSPQVPQAFAQLIDTLMAKAPENRPQTAQALQAMLLPWTAVPVECVQVAERRATTDEAIAIRLSPTHVYRPAAYFVWGIMVAAIANVLVVVATCLVCH